MSAPELSAAGDLVRRGDADRFLSAMTAPPEARERLFALYAFNLEVARIPSVVSEPMLGLMRLQWWREAVEDAFAGRVRSHEIAEPLAKVIAERKLPREPFERLLTARERDLEPSPFPDRAALDAYLHDTAGSLLALSAIALAGEAGPTESAGLAFGAAAWLRAVPALSAQGRTPFPPGDPRLHAQALARDALWALGVARSAGAPEAAAPAYRAGWRAEQTLRAALAEDYDPDQGPAEPSELRRRAGLLWRAARGSW